MKKTAILLALMISISGNVFAKAESIKKMTDPSENVKKLIRTNFPTITPGIGVKKVDGTSLYEVNMLGKLSYTDERASFLILNGQVFVPGDNGIKNITEERQEKAMQEILNVLPLNMALKRVYGKGERTVVTFEDPDCEMCQAQHRVLEKGGDQINATIYTFLFPLKKHPDAPNKINFIWCQKDPNAAYHDWMNSGAGIPLDKNGNMLANKIIKCDRPEVKVGLRLAKDLNYHETPRFIFKNGMGTDHALKLEELVKILNELEKIK